MKRERGNQLEGATLNETPPNAGLSLSILVINWNSIELTLDCLRRTAAAMASDSPSYEVIVVDNGSRDPNEAARLESSGLARVIRLSKNSGFVGGMNTAANAASGRILLFLNNDAYPVAQGSIQRMMVDLEADPVVGSVGPRFEHEAEQGTPGVLRSAPWINGAALMIRRDDFLRLGGFDSDFFIYHEEVLLCRALRAENRRLLVDDAAVFHHAPGTTTKKLGHFERFLRTRNYWLLYARAPPKTVTLVEILRLPKWLVTGFVGSLVDMDWTRLVVHLSANWNGCRAAVGNKAAADPLPPLRKLFPDLDVGPARVIDAAQTAS